MQMSKSVRGSLVLMACIFLIMSCSSRLSKGDDFMDKYEYPAAIESYDEFIKKNPDDPEVPKAKERIAECYY